MALADDVAGSRLVIKYGKTTDLWRRFGDHESHFGVLSGADVRIVSYLLTDEDEIDRAEEIVKNWFDVAAEPLNSTGPQTLRGGGKRSVNYNEVVLPAKNLPKAVTLYKQQQTNFARDGILLRDTSSETSTHTRRYEPASTTQRQTASRCFRWDLVGRRRNKQQRHQQRKRAADPLPTPGKRARTVQAATPTSNTKNPTAPAASSPSPSSIAAFQARLRSFAKINAKQRIRLARRLGICRPSWN
ncbi:hypothetical protein HDU89_003025 [Geranomyces variabilis]|nr:hypothetical protein HDU89_003025 [Geranomyces variabilis]